MNRGVGLHLLEPLQRTHLRVWLIAVLFFGLGDVATTALGLGMSGITEVAPIAAVLIQQYGLGALIPLKLFVLGGCYLVWTHTPHPHRMGVPLGLAIVGVVATGWNFHVLAVVILGPPLIGSDARIIASIGMKLLGALRLETPGAFRPMLLFAGVILGYLFHATLVALR